MSMNQLTDILGGSVNDRRQSQSFGGVDRSYGDGKCGARRKSGYVDALHISSEFDLTVGIRRDRTLPRDEIARDAMETDVRWSPTHRDGIGRGGAGFNVVRFGENYRETKLSFEGRSV